MERGAIDDTSLRLTCLESDIPQFLALSNQIFAKEAAEHPGIKLDPKFTSLESWRDIMRKEGVLFGGFVSETPVSFIFCFRNEKDELKNFIIQNESPGLFLYFLIYFISFLFDFYFYLIFIFIYFIFIYFILILIF